MDDASKPKLNGPLTVDTEFQPTNLGLRVCSRLAVIERSRTIGWSGKGLYIRSAVIWGFFENNGKMKVRSEESLDGFMIVSFMGLRLR